ncbi:ribokinase [Neorhizobium sp. BETTINA12A]|uniref:ribokinase n=1 Tax=Neorhizobium sp. BETTINA12A TaxID=2908924 RepID=UPI001FF55280|nr:ribokinase [Neorhizobium sp. BETTINA12A]MCJ9751393.1 ribokinase [Neorhizobium sp. BETTINA12A]
MITVLGSINMDLIATTERLPQPGETVAGSSFATAAGGKGANQALAARRAGSSVHMVGAVGEDGFAAPALALLDDAKVDLSAVARVTDPTGTALILVGGTGENMIAVVAGANGTVSTAQAEAAVEAMKIGDILMLQLEIPAETVETALNAARAKGIQTVINTAPLTGDAARLARLADIVIANETEFELLAGSPIPDAAARQEMLKKLHAETGQTYVVTLGGDGVVAIRDGEIIAAEGLKIEPVDTVGAGDTFCGYLTASLEQGLDFAKALRRAAVAGSLACLSRGAQPSIPPAEAVDARV